MPWPKNGQLITFSLPCSTVHAQLRLSDWGYAIKEMVFIKIDNSIVRYYENKYVYFIAQLLYSKGIHC